jgi:hypothetical protein
MAPRTLAERHKTVKGYAIALILQSIGTDYEGRNVGLSYREILARIRKAFPIITYNGPHKGQPIKMTVKQLREIAYTMQSENRKLRLPVRPRSDRKKRGQSGSAITNQPKVAPVTPATRARQKG